MRVPTRTPHFPEGQQSRAVRGGRYTTSLLDVYPEHPVQVGGVAVLPPTWSHSPIMGYLEYSRFPGNFLER